MKKIISLLIILAMLTSMLFTLASCLGSTPTPTPDDSDHPSKDDDEEDEEDEEGDDDDTPPIKVPEYKDYGRDTQDFDALALSYARPDTDALCAEFDKICSAIRQNELPFEEQLAMINAIEDAYWSYRTMYSLAEIFTYKDASLEMWSEEYSIIAKDAPRVAQAVEDMYVAAAQSPHVDRFEDEYFGDELYEDYADGGMYTDEVVELMSTEAEYISEYNSLSTATVVIEYNGQRGTYDELVESLNENHAYYDTLLAIYYELYEAEYNKLSADIYVELINIRRDIADALGKESYIELAYDDMDYEYDPDTMLSFLGDINDYVLPVYKDLYSKEFYPHFANYRPSTIKADTLVNTLYAAYKENNEEFADIYAYMLQHKLYDISLTETNRYEGAFTAYLYSNNSPYLFASTSGNALDYISVSHEFGHFIDGYVNWGDNPSLELAEVSSQALEFLTLGMLENKLGASTYKYLKYELLAGVFETLIYQGFYSLFEHYAYTLAPGELSLDDLEGAVSAAYLEIFGEQTYLGLEAVLIPHLIVSPFYVQSYCTSVVPSVEIYLAECMTKGAGMQIYTTLINRGDTEYTFVEYLEFAGLSSPFEQHTLKNISNRIYYHVYGKYYFKGATGGSNEV